MMKEKFTELLNEMINRLFILCMMLFLGGQTILGQQLTIESFKTTNDLSVSIQRRLDTNGKPCALLKVQLAVDRVTFGGNILQPVENQTGEYWVYMPEGTEALIVQCPDRQPIHIRFADYGIQGGLKSLTCYTLTLVQSITEEPTGLLRVDYQPYDAEVWIDGKKAGTTPDLFRNISPGSHGVEIRNQGYNRKKLTVEIKAGEMTSIEGGLMAVGVACTTNGNVDIYTVKGVSFSMVHVNGGTFMMDRNDSNSQVSANEVTLPDYQIGKTEVTQALWTAVMGKNPSKYKGNGMLPVEMMNWKELHEFIVKLSLLTGRLFRLPTEAEWEFAARGGNKSKGYRYAGSNDPNKVAWYENNKNSRNHPVAQKTPNELGLYDMSGNVWEWCENGYCRGGVYFIHDLTPTSRTLRSTSDIGRYDDVGFRLAQ